MKRVMRLNKQLRIPDEALPDYLDKGFFEINDIGKVINKPKAVDAEKLSKENAALKKEVGALKAELQALGEQGKK